MKAIERPHMMPYEQQFARLLNPDIEPARSMTKGYAEFLNGRAQADMMRNKPRVTTPLWKGARHWLQRSIDNEQHKIRHAYDGYSNANVTQDIMEHAGTVQSAIAIIDQRKHLLHVLRAVGVCA